MDGFSNDKQQESEVHSAFAEIVKIYPEYITQLQALEICRVAPKTIRKWQQEGHLQFEVVNDGLRHCHAIKRDDILALLYSKHCLEPVDGDYMIAMRRYYIQKYISYPDGLVVSDVVEMTGYVKQTVAKWMHKNLLNGYNRGKLFRIPKKHLIDFVCSPYYRQIVRKSKTHTIDVQSFLEEYKKRK